jgi:hypothetical protein
VGKIQRDIRTYILMHTYIYLYMDLFTYVYLYSIYIHIYIYLYICSKGGHQQFKSAPPQLRNIADNQIDCRIADLKKLQNCKI